MRWTRVDAVAVFTLASIARIGTVSGSPGGVTGVIGYDPTVYYTASAALVHGRAPYADFVLVHPPAITIALTPFVALGAWWGDRAGYIAANLGFEALGALNAVLVLLIARRWGLRRSAALLGAVFYAGYFGAVRAELAARLEPLGTVLFLLAVLLLSGTARRWRAGAVGALLGAAVMVKIWWIAPALVLLGWLWWRSGRRAGAVGLAGLVAAVVVIGGPFFALAPRAMLRMVVFDQLHRGYAHDLDDRLATLTSVDTLFPRQAITTTNLVLSLLVLLLLVLAGVAGWRVAAARPVLLCAVIELAVLGSSPRFYAFYPGLVGGAFALTVAAGAHAAPRWARLPSLASVGLAVGLTVAAMVTRPYALSVRFPVAQLQPGLRGVRCLTSNSPAAAIELDRLGRELDAGCPNLVDVDGSLFDSRFRGDQYFRRSPGWQRLILRYLRSGDAVLDDPTVANLSSDTRRALARGAVLARSGRFAVYRTGG